MRNIIYFSLIIVRQIHCVVIKDTYKVFILYVLKIHMFSFLTIKTVLRYKTNKKKIESFNNTLVLNKNFHVFFKLLKNTIDRVDKIR